MSWGGASAPALAAPAPASPGPRPRGQVSPRGAGSPGCRRGPGCHPRTPRRLARARSHLPPHLRVLKKLQWSLKAGGFGAWTRFCRAARSWDPRKTSRAGVGPSGCFEVGAFGGEPRSSLVCETHAAVGTPRGVPPPPGQGARGSGVQAGAPLRRPLSPCPPCLPPQQLRWGWGKVRRAKACLQNKTHSKRTG